MNEEPLVIVERRERVLVMTIDRPQVRNALNGAAAVELEAAMGELDSDPELWVGVLTGADGTFCSGQDLKAVGDGGSCRTEKGGWFGFLDNPPDKTLIAAIEGSAVAGGFEMALACDLIVAARDARLGIPEARHSLVAVGGGLIRLPRRIPYHVAMEMALTAESKSAEEMHRYGLVNRVCEPGGALATALDLADLVCRNGPLAVSATRQVVKASIVLGDESEVWAVQDDVVALDDLMASADFNEGLRAFAEKRQPVWQNR